MLVVAIELQEQLLAQEVELDSREGTIIMWEDGLAASEHALGGGRARNVMSSAPRLRLSGRTTLLGHVPLLSTSSTPLTSTGCWRNTRSSFPYRR
jgi:hypothetical protein